MRIVSCTRAEAAEKLAYIAEGWAHLGHPERAAEAKAALVWLNEGSREVRVGHTIYRIREASAA